MLLYWHLTLMNIQSVVSFKDIIFFHIKHGLKQLLLTR